MTKLTIMRSTNDNKAWLVDVDGVIVSEIESEAVAANTDQTIVVEVRAQAASHNYHTI